MLRLIFCDGSYANLRVPCRFCSRLWVMDAKFFCEAVTYHFDRVYTDNLFSFHLDQLFSLHKKMFLTLLRIWASQKFDSDIVSARVNRYMNVWVAKSDVEIIECYLEVLVRLLFSSLVQVGHSFLQMYKEFDYEHGVRREKLFLDYAVKAVKRFFNECCSQLKVETFLHIYKVLSPKLDCYPNSFKIINQHYLEYLDKTFDKK